MQKVNLSIRLFGKIAFKINIENIKSLSSRMHLLEILELFYRPLESDVFPVITLICNHITTIVDFFEIIFQSCKLYCTLLHLASEPYFRGSLIILEF